MGTIEVYFFINFHEASGRMKARNVMKLSRPKTGNN
jgi:hypothetical protein